MIDALIRAFVALDRSERSIHAAKADVLTAIVRQRNKRKAANSIATSSAVTRGHVRSVVEDLSPAPPTHTGMMCFDVASEVPESAADAIYSCLLCGKSTTGTHRCEVFR